MLLGRSCYHTLPSVLREANEMVKRGRIVTFYRSALKAKFYRCNFFLFFTCFYLGAFFIS